MNGLGPPGATAARRLECNLPVSLSTFIGRGPEQDEVASLLRSSRLVTITGTGGSGKTRLALEVATRLFAEGHIGAFVVELGAVTEGAQVEAAVATALGASVCRRLDGLPLAIELATARLPSMSLVHLDERLSERFRLLTGGPRMPLPGWRSRSATMRWRDGAQMKPSKGRENWATPD